MNISYQKLVRDKIPDIIEKLNGKKAKTRILINDADYRVALDFKLMEETRELQEVLRTKPIDKKAIMDEVADIKEVLDAILALYEIDTETALNHQIDKRLLKGGFEKRVYLEEVEE